MMKNSVAPAAPSTKNAAALFEVGGTVGLKPNPPWWTLKLHNGRLGAHGYHQIHRSENLSGGFDDCCAEKRRREYAHKCLQPKRCNTMKSGSVVENENNKLLDTVAVGSYVLVGRPTGHWRKVKIGAYCWDKSFVVIYGERHQVNTFGAVWLFSPFLCHWPPTESGGRIGHRWIQIEFFYF